MDTLSTPELQAAPAAPATPSQPQAGQSLLIPWEQLEPNPWNRKIEDSSLGEEFIASIRRGGIRENLTVRPHPQGPKEGKPRYQIASGECRWRGAQVAGNCPLLPCNVKDLTDEDVAEMNITANVQRRDIPPLEMARMVHGYMDQFKKTQEETAEKFGKTQSWVSELVGYLSLTDVIKNIGAPILCQLGWDQLRALKASPIGIQTQVAKELKEGALKPQGVAKRCKKLSSGLVKQAIGGNKALVDPFKDKWEPLHNSVPYANGKVAYPGHNHWRIDVEDCGDPAGQAMADFLVYAGLAIGGKVPDKEGMDYIKEIYLKDNTNIKKKEIVSPSTPASSGNDDDNESHLKDDAKDETLSASSESSRPASPGPEEDMTDEEIAAAIAEQEALGKF